MYIPETRYLTGTTNSSDNLDGEGSSTSTGYDAGTSSVDRATNVLGPLPDLYQINTTAVSVGFLLLAAILVLLMQLGLTQLEAGLSRATNAQHVYMKNQLSLAVSALCFYFVGFGLAFGEGEAANAFVGSEAFALHNIKRAYMWFAQFAFAINASSVWHGAVTGRMRFMAYLWITAVMTSIVYPIAAHWVWSPEGWLYNIGETGVIDFSGGGPVHVIGGTTGLIGAWMIGPRLAFLRDKGSKFASAHNKPLAAAGTTMLFIGWIAYTTVTSASVSMYYQAEVAGRVATVTVLAASAASVVSFAVRRVFSGSYDLIWLNNSMVAGLVSITGPCACISTWAAIIIGSIGAGLHAGAAAIFRRLGIDDPLDSVSIHLICGMWGLIAAGLFADPTLLAQTKGVVVDQIHAYGLLYGGGVLCLGQQVLAIVVMIAWATLTMTGVFAVLRCTSRLRISKEAELGGVDLFKHSSLAYPDFALGMEESSRLRNTEYTKDMDRTLGPNQITDFTTEASGVGLEFSNNNQQTISSSHHPFSSQPLFGGSHSGQHIRARSSILRSHSRKLYQDNENNSNNNNNSLALRAPNPTNEAEGITSLSFDDDDTNNDNNKPSLPITNGIITDTVVENKNIDSIPNNNTKVDNEQKPKIKPTFWNSLQGFVNTTSSNVRNNFKNNKLPLQADQSVNGTKYETEITQHSVPFPTVAAPAPVLHATPEHHVQQTISVPLGHTLSSNDKLLPISSDLSIKHKDLDKEMEEADYAAQFYDTEAENYNYDDNIDVDEDLDWHTSVSAQFEKEKHLRRIYQQHYGWDGERKSTFQKYDNNHDDDDNMIDYSANEWNYPQYRSQHRHHHHHEIDSPNVVSNTINYDNTYYPNYNPNVSYYNNSNFPIRNNNAMEYSNYNQQQHPNTRNRSNIQNSASLLPNNYNQYPQQSQQVPYDQQQQQRHLLLLQQSLLNNISENNNTANYPINNIYKSTNNNGWNLNNNSTNSLLLLQNLQQQQQILLAQYQQQQQEQQMQSQDVSSLEPSNIININRTITPSINNKETSFVPIVSSNIVSIHDNDNNSPINDNTSVGIPNESSLDQLDLRKPIENNINEITSLP